MAEMLGTRDVYGDTLAELGQAYPQIVVLDADLSSSTKTGVFGKAFPDRFFNMGVCEQSLVDTACGFALAGKLPFVSTFAIFTMRAWEQIRQCVAIQNLNVKIVASHGGVTVGEDGASAQAIEDVALMRVLPRMSVIVPADGIETRAVIRALVEHVGPTYVRVARAKFPVILPKDYVFRLGRGVVLHEGGDATVVAMGVMVSRALEAARLLKEEGLSVRVINMSTVKPIDEELLHRAALETGGVVTAEEHSVIGGLGGAVAELLAERCPVPMRRIGMQDRFGTSGDAESLLAHFGLTAEAIAEAVRDVVKRKAHPR